MSRARGELGGKLKLQVHPSMAGSPSVRMVKRNKSCSKIFQFTLRTFDGREIIQKCMKAAEVAQGLASSFILLCQVVQVLRQLINSSTNVDRRSNTFGIHLKEIGSPGPPKIQIQARPVCLSKSACQLPQPIFWHQQPCSQDNRCQGKSRRHHNCKANTPRFPSLGVTYRGVHSSLSPQVSTGSVTTSVFQAQDYRIPAFARIPFLSF